MPGVEIEGGDGGQVHGLIDELTILLKEDERSLGFKLKYNKKGLQVWSRAIKNDPSKMMKVSGVLPASAESLFNTLLDNAYREHWDPSARKSATLFRLGPVNSTIEYYHAKMPSPVRDRDMVTRLEWSHNEEGFILAQKSVEFDAAPACKTAIRGVIMISGYSLNPVSDTECRLSYINHSDPRGSLPKMIINHLSTSLAPKTVWELVKAAQGYNRWKERQSQPNLQPWLNFEQMSALPLFDRSQHGELRDTVEGQRPLVVGSPEDSDFDVDGAGSEPDD